MERLQRQQDDKPRPSLLTELSSKLPLHPRLLHQKSTKICRYPETTPPNASKHQAWIYLHNNHTGHGYIQADLATVSKEDPTCPHWQDEDQTVDHLLFTCPTFQYQRFQTATLLVVVNPNIDIPKYDGTEDPRPWIESLEEIGFLYHWADYIISRYAAMNMIGSAKTWLNLHKKSFTSLENSKSRLIEDFASDANKEEMKMRLNRMQQWNEPAIRFAEDILVLCNKVDPQME
ncbi:hypothetical protein LAZ67_2004512 [Cordylochernes scorpioides]|uniref:Reverse transcriptase zinc-binding domain-containing protein n=1 Tax=Cordylochernes scorpioides TaxID=51811 RepID=A0ABY6K8D7_9ARAC|nr:hypothetical protein LAZ67_2004512 [Cordylochernes scorpioides]